MSLHMARGQTKTLSVIGTPELMHDIYRVMKEYGITQSAAVRLLLATGLGKVDVLSALPKEGISAAYSVSIQCYARMYSWMQAECDAVDWNVAEIAKVPERLSKILGIARPEKESTEVVDP